jgi:hypothetical protein
MFQVFDQCMKKREPAQLLNKLRNIQDGGLYMHNARIYTYMYDVVRRRQEFYSSVTSSGPVLIVLFQRDFIGTGANSILLGR